MGWSQRAGAPHRRVEEGHLALSRAGDLQEVPHDASAHPVALTRVQAHGPRHARILLDLCIRYAILMAGDSHRLIRLLESAGWRCVRTRGSHWQFKHPTKPGLITVPHPTRDLPTGTWRAIVRAAGLLPRHPPDST